MGVVEGVVQVVIYHISTSAAKLDRRVTHVCISRKVDEVGRGGVGVGAGQIDRQAEIRGGGTVLTYLAPS